MMNGVIVRIVKAKNFGFIRGEDQNEYFFHREDFYGFFEDLATDFELGRKIRVTFEPVDSARGLRANDVNRTDSGV